MSEKITVEDILKPYNSRIEVFNNEQKKCWDLWSYNLPQRIAMIRNGLRLSNKKIDSWQNIAYIGIILSAAVPIVVDILKKLQNWSDYALILDAVFPAVVGIVQKKIGSWSNKRHTFTSVFSSYDRLLFEVVIDIEKGLYQEKEDIHKDKWEELENILLNAGLSSF